MDIYKEITDRIVAELEQGIIPWQKPWIGSSNGAISHTSGKPYSMLNQMLLGRPGEYITFKQCKERGGTVRKGEKSKMVVFWKWIEKPAENDEKKIDRFPFLRYFNVFHIDQCDGIKPRFAKSEIVNEIQPDAAADAIMDDYIQRSGVGFRNEQGDRAFYRPSEDSITLPLFNQFSDMAEYYSTAFHEAVHSTGHASRLNRLDATAHFGNEEYSREELVAEIGAAALVNVTGLESNSSFKNSVAYIQNWLRVLKDDKKLIVSAAGRADKAVSLIMDKE